MKELEVQTLFEIVGRIEDPRVVGRTWHQLLDIIVIAVCASICGAEDWHDIAEFGKSRREWFAEKLELAHGIPSHDTFRRVFILLEAEDLERVFLEWMQASVSLSKGSLINI